MDDIVLVFGLIVIPTLLVMVHSYLKKVARKADEKNRHKKRQKREQSEQLNKLEKL